MYLWRSIGPALQLPRPEQKLTHEEDCNVYNLDAGTSLFVST